MWIIEDVAQLSEVCESFIGGCRIMLAINTPPMSCSASMTTNWCLTKLLRRPPTVDHPIWCGAWVGCAAADIMKLGVGQR